jgi:hypothetical protein
MRGKLHLEDWISAKLKWLRHAPSVMPGLDLGIHLSSQEKSRCWRWIAGSSPAMTAAYHRVTCADTASHFPYNGEANFPEFHNVYIDPCSYAAEQEDQCISGRNNILQEAATDAARAKLRRFANRAFRSGLLSRTVEMAAEPGPRRLARAERQRLLHLIPFYRDHRRVSSKLDRAPMPPPRPLPPTRLAVGFRTPSICLRAREAVPPHTVAVEPRGGNSPLATESMDDRCWRSP